MNLIKELKTGGRIIVPNTVSYPKQNDDSRSQALPRIGLRDCCAQIHEDWIAHDRQWSRPGFRAVAVHRLGVWRMQIQPRWLRLPFSFLYGQMFQHVRNHYGIELPYSVRLGRRVIVEHQGGIVIHGNAEIGDDCILRQGVTLGIRHLDRVDEAPKLGVRVNVGAGAKILGAVIIGDDANIGANAVVLCDVPAGATAIGIPAKIIRSKPIPSKPYPPSTGVLLYDLTEHDLTEHES
jgi:serine O-acetyltransferase